MRGPSERFYFFATPLILMVSLVLSVFGISAQMICLISGFLLAISFPSCLAGFLAFPTSASDPAWTHTNQLSSRTLELAGALPWSFLLATLPLVKVPNATILFASRITLGSLAGVPGSGIFSGQEPL